MDHTSDGKGSPNIDQPLELIVENEDSQAASSGLNPQAANWAPPVATTPATKTYITEKVKAAPPEPYQPPWMLSIRMYNEIEAVLFLRHPTPYQDALFVPLTRMYTSMLEGAKAMLVVDALEKLIRHNRANEEPAPTQGVAIATDYLWFSHIDEEARTRQSNDLPPLRQCNQEQKVALNRSWGSFVQSLKNATLVWPPYPSDHIKPSTISDGSEPRCFNCKERFNMFLTCPECKEVFHSFRCLFGNTDHRESCLTIRQQAQPMMAGNKSKAQNED
ncbi:hypothetical protein C8035_v004601 [Colletotrichum spinosum]|uniref:Uncharacterized protein n=1 Tax=Colletotrichum spinosum TaxID=1347390 RepID=A0A4R8PXQ8_9PEZI|nr:hypothetical protein C8035_v004601 [Colletotrichum spinosum]